MSFVRRQVIFWKCFAVAIAANDIGLGEGGDFHHKC
jgi:hypothetical protein